MLCDASTGDPDSADTLEEQTVLKESAAEVEQAFEALAGLQMLHALAVDAVEAVSIGMRVQPRWREEPRGHVTDLECFVPE